MHVWVKLLELNTYIFTKSFMPAFLVFGLVWFGSHNILAQLAPQRTKLRCFVSFAPGHAEFVSKPS